MVIAVRSVPVVLGDAGLLFVKLCALALMVLDHVDWFLLDGSLAFHSTWGRVVAPAFAVVLALNLARCCPGADVRAFWRMMIGGVLACLPYVLLQGSLFPLNIMFTLALAVGVVALGHRFDWVWGAVLAVCGALFVDYQWWGVAGVVVPFWLLSRGYSLWVAALVSAACFAWWNGSVWSFAVLGLVWMGSLFSGEAPRLKWLFYVAYPLHLWGLWLVGQVVR